MPHESCVAHPTRNWYFHFRLDYYGITGEDHCAAAALYLFEFMTNCALDQMNSEGESGEPWISITKQGLSDGMIDLFSPRSIFDAVKKLESMGFLSSRGQEETKGAKEYLLNFDLVSQKISEWDLSTAGKFARRKFNSYAGKFARGIEKPQANLHAGGRQICTPLYKEVIHSFKDINIKENKESPLLPSKIKTETLPGPELSENPEVETQCPGDFILQSTYDLQLAEDVSTFVKNAYRQSRGSKISNAELKRYTDRFSSCESSSGPEEFRSSLWTYLNTSDDWLREHKWPVAAFLKDPSRYLPEEQKAPGRRQTHPASASPETFPCLTSQEAPAIDPAESENNTCNPVHIWDTLIPDRPAGNLTVRTAKKVEQSRSDPDFTTKNFGAVVRKCRKLIDNGEETAFSWLFQGPNGGDPNWASVLEGKFDFLMKSKAKAESQMSVTDRLIAKAEAEEREEAARKQIGEI